MVDREGNLDNSCGIQYQFLPADSGSTHDPGPGTLFLGTAEQGGRVLGRVRCSRVGNRAGHFRIRGLKTLVPYRNQGIATTLLRCAAREIFSRLGGTVIFSFILPENIASIRAHERAGFRQVTPPFPGPERYLCYGLRPDGVIKIPPQG